MIKIQKIKRDEFIHNYVKRVKKFINKLNDDPNYLSNYNSLFLPSNNINNTVKEDNNSQSYFNPKRFCFSTFETDRMKAEKYDKQQKNLKELLDKNFPIKNNNKENKSLSPKNNFYQNFNINSKILKINGKSENNKMLQPRLRFKPRNDMERLLDEIKDLRLYHGNVDYLNTLKRYIIKMQKLEFNNEIKKINKLKKNKNFQEKEIIPYNEKNNQNNYNKDYKKNIINEYINFNEKNKLIFKNIFNQKENKLKKDIKLLEKIINDESNNELSSDNDIDNLTQNELVRIINKEEKFIMSKKKEDIIKAFLSAMKSLYKEYDIKTYFNCMKNFSLWKSSCFLDNKLIKRRNKNNSKTNSQSKFEFSKNSNSYKENCSNKKDNLKNPSKTFYKKLNVFKNKSNININSNPLKLVPLLNDYKNNFYKLNPIIGNKYKENKTKDENKEIIFNDDKNKFNIIKKIAFEKDFKGYNFSSNNSTENYESYKKQFSLKKINDKGNEKNKVYTRDIGETCNKILKKFGFIKKKYRESDASYSKGGNGKLMFTNGLTVSEFSKLHSLSF